MAFEGQIDQLVNLLTDLTRQPRKFSPTSDMRISSSNEKKKTLRVQISVSGVVARQLVPDPKKGAKS